MRLFRLSKKGAGSILGPLESEVMEIVWSKGDPVTVSAVHQRLGEKSKKDLAYSTVKAVLSNLAEKGHLKKRSDGRSNIFVAVRTREEFRNRVVEEVLGSLGKDYRNPLLVHLVDKVGSDTRALDELERLIEARRRELRK